MHIWIIQTGEPMFTDGSKVRPMRAMNLASKALELNHRVTIITSNFDHFTKKKRFEGDKLVLINPNLDIHFIDSPGYKRNISLRRFYDHFIMGYRMKNIAAQLPKPDVAFIGFPPIETTWFMAKLFKSWKIKYLIDVKDAWPSNIVDVFPSSFRFFIRFLLTPYFQMFGFSVKNAWKICSISDEFLKWSQKTGRRKSNNSDFVAYLTSKNIEIKEQELSDARRWFKKNIELKPDLPTLYFIGSLSRSFDFHPVIESAKKGTFNLVIGGNGEQFSELSSLTSDLKNIHLVGWVDAAQSQIIAEMSDFALAPMKALPDFEMSIPNKFFDYMRRGTPILSSLNGASRKLIENRNMGRFYGDFEELSHLIAELYKDKKLTLEMSRNCRKVFATEFDYNLVYEKLVHEIVG